MKMHRRSFLKHAAVTGGGISLAGSGVAVAGRALAVPVAATRAAPRGNPIGVSTYSFSRYNGERTTVMQGIDLAAEMGFDATTEAYARSSTARFRRTRKGSASRRTRAATSSI